MNCFIACLAGAPTIIRVPPFGSHEGCYPGMVLCQSFLRAVLTTRSVSPWKMHLK